MKANTNPTRAPRTAHTQRSTNNKVIKRWVRKDLLDAQAHQEFKWIPKVPKRQPPKKKPTRHRAKSSITRQGKPYNMQYNEHSISRLVWLPKCQVHRIPNGMAWIPKQQQNLTGKAMPSPSTSKNSQTMPNPLIKKQWVPTGRSLQVRQTSPLKEAAAKQETLKMCFKALNLQKQLFGMTSLLLPQKSWMEYVRKQQGYVPLKPQPWKEQLRMKQGYARLPAQSHSIPRSIQVS